MYIVCVIYQTAFLSPELNIEGGKTVFMAIALTCISPSTCLSSPWSSLDLVPEQLRQRVNPVVLDGNSSGQADVGVRQ